MARTEIDVSWQVCRGTAVSRVQGHRDRKMSFHPFRFEWYCTWERVVTDEATHGKHVLHCDLTKPVDDALQIVHHLVMPA